MTTPNSTGKQELLNPQGANPTERTENSRIMTVGVTKPTVGYISNLKQDTDGRPYFNIGSDDYLVLTDSDHRPYIENK